MDDSSCAHRLDLPWVTDTATLPARAVRAMRAVCDTCPVRVACAAYVDAAAITGGTWAGEDRDTIHRINREGRRQAPVLVQDPLPGLDDLLGGVA